MTENKVVYISSPYEGDDAKNIEFAKLACQFAIRENCTPIAAHLLYSQFLDDSDPKQQEASIRMGLRLLEACDELWLCGDQAPIDISNELAIAEWAGIPVRRFLESEIRRM